MNQHLEIIILIHQQHYIVLDKRRFGTSFVTNTLSKRIIKHIPNRDVKR